MVCIYCGADTHVINSRPQKRVNQIWRRRRCTMCDTVFSTSEAADYSKSLLVHNKSLVAFDRDRLFLSLHKSLAHRPSAISDASALTNTIISRLKPTAGAIDRAQIIQVTVVALSRFDNLAAQHYAATHRY